jgi:hypothetical protein
MEKKKADQSTVSAALALLAFNVEIDSVHCIVFAATKAKARWIAVKGYREAGYNSHGGWPNAVAHRIPRLDNSPLKQRPAQCWAPDYAESIKG